MIQENPTVIDLVRANAERFAGLPAIIDGERRWTHAELWDRVDRLSQGLAALGAGKGDIVMAWLPNAGQAIECELAALQSGFIWVSLNLRVTWGEAIGMLKSAPPKILIVSSESFERLERDHPSLTGARLVVSHEAGTVEEEAGAHPEGVIDYEALIAGSEARRPAVEIADTDIARLRYTSGTTGSAKAAVLPHRVYKASLKNLQHELHAMDTNDRVLHAAPLTHASGAMMFPVLAAGGANVMMRRFDADETLRLIERAKITTMFIVPTMIQRLISSPLFEATDLSSLRSVMYGGAPIPVERLEPLIERIGPALIHILGMTEAPYPICTLQREEHWIGNPKLGCIGRPTTICEVKLVDEDGHEVKSGEVGEILIRGENVMDGYWNDEEATRAVLKDGWLASGDLAVKDEDGDLRIVDRKKDVIITGGFNVYPKELEERLAQFDEVAEVAVVGHPHRDWGEMVVAYLVPQPGSTIDVEKIEAWAHRELSAYKRPKEIRVVDELPKNPSGKIMKKALRRG